MNVGRVLALPLGLAVAVGLTACFSAPPRPAPTVPTAPVTPPPKPDSIPEVIPRIEPRARSGNPPFYDVFGKRYYVLSSSVGYRERGVASWYGPGFHNVRTSIGEPYDMYGMTAAHKTLPLPAYVRVTNLQNGRSVVVRVNDRGPFVGNRIIDLSYSAAVKLDMLRNGTAMVEVRTIDPSVPPPVITASATPAPAAAPPAATALTIVAPAAAAPASSAPAGSAPAGSAPAGNGTRHRHTDRGLRGHEPRGRRYRAVRASRRVLRPCECGTPGGEIARRQLRQGHRARRSDRGP